MATCDGRRARERAPVRRDQAAAGRDRRAGGRARDHQRESSEGLSASSSSRRCSSSSANGCGEIFDAQVALHRAPRPDTGLIQFPYTIERGVRSRTSRCRSWASGAVIDDDASRCSINERRHRAGDRVRSSRRDPGRAATDTSSGRAAHRRGDAIGVISLQNLDRPYAFSEADERVLDHPRLEHERRARERAPVRRDEAAADGDGRACRRARDHQRRPAGPRRRRSRCRRCTTSSAIGCARSSTPRCSTSGSTTARRGSSTSRTRSSAGSGSRTSRSRSWASAST